MQRESGRESVSMVTIWNISRFLPARNQATAQVVARLFFGAFLGKYSVINPVSYDMGPDFP